MSYSKLRKNNILLTGKPGIGKTTIIKKIVEKYKEHSAGFYTEEIKEKGGRVGFKIKNITGDEGILSHINIKSNCNVGKYGVNINVIDSVGVSAVENGLECNQTELIIIDEIAKMELFSRNFREIVISTLNSSKIVIATIQEKNIPFLNKIKERADVEIFRITIQNRDNILENICNYIKSNRQ